MERKGGNEGEKKKKKADYERKRKTEAGEIGITEKTEKDKGKNRDEKRLPLIYRTRQPFTTSGPNSCRLPGLEILWNIMALVRLE